MQSKKEKVVFTSAVANASSAPFNAMDDEIVNFTVVGVGGAVTAKVTFLSSDQFKKPDFTAAASVTNRYTETTIKDLLSGSAIAGGTGISLAAAGIFRVTLNDSKGHKWVGAKLDWTAGAISIWVSTYKLK